MVKHRKVRIEASSACQLRCPLCPTGAGTMGSTVGTGVLKFTDFAAFLDGHPDVKEIELSNWGEILLNPELSAIMELAHDKGVALSARNGVNFNTATESVLEDLVKYRFRSMVASIDGASQESYRIYRVRGDFDQVIDNIKTVNRYKAKYRSVYPLLTWKFLIFGHNEHEIAKAREMAIGLGMMFYPDLNSEPDWAPPTDTEQVRQDSGLPAASKQEHEEKFQTVFTKNFCYQLWNEPQINWDGKILGCCMNTWDDFGGNAFEQGDALEGEKLQYARDMLLGEASPRDDIPCTTCKQYLGMKQHDDWLTMRKVRLDGAKKRLKERIHVLLNRRLFRPFAHRLLSRAAASARWRL